MKIKDVVKLMSGNQEIIVWSYSHVETLFAGIKDELNDELKALDLKHIEGSFMPNVIRLFVDWGNWYEKMFYTTN